MQLGSKENENERFKHYLEKTFKKTASLIANSCKAVCTFCLNNKMKFRAEKEVKRCYFIWIVGVNSGEFWSWGAWDRLSIWTKCWHCIPGNLLTYVWIISLGFYIYFGPIIYMCVYYKSTILLFKYHHYYFIFVIHIYEAFMNVACLHCQFIYQLSLRS